MNNPANSVWYEQLDAFFTALERHELSHCRACLARLHAFTAAQAHPAQAIYKRWCIYLSGILANEQEHDWGKAEAIFSGLLAQELEPTLHGRTLLALGRTYEYQGRWYEAVQTHQATLPLFAASAQTQDQAKAYKNMALAYWLGFVQSDLGADVLPQAIAWCHNALALLPTEPAEPDWLTGSVWNTLGLLHRCRAEWEQARQCFLKDLAICRALDDRHGMGLTYGNLGEIYQHMGQDHWQAAQHAFEQALDLIREFDNHFDEIEALANLAYFHQQCASRSAALRYWDEAIRMVESVRRGISSDVARTGFFATIIDIFAHAVLLAHELGETAAAFGYAEQARARSFLDLLHADELQTAYTGAPATGLPAVNRPLSLAPLSLTEVQATLPADALLLTYFTTGLEETRLDRNAARQGAQRHRFPPGKILLFAIQHNSAQIHTIHLSPNSLRPHQLANVVESHFLQPQMRRALYDQLLAPVATQIETAQRLYIVPHGPLHYIPFAALLDSTDTPLVRPDRPGPALHYGLSATLLLHRPSTQRQRAPSPGLALGYNGGAPDDAPVVRLHFAEEEAASIARMIGAESWLGDAPKKTALMAQAARYRLLHFSCHGVFDPERPLASALYLAKDEALPAREIVEELALCAELVTLSACESGLSRIRRGDELLGLLQAFLQAGAANILATLWRVDEHSTRLLMEQFYRQRQMALPLAEALLAAQQWLMQLTVADLTTPLRQEVTTLRPQLTPESRPFADPYYWAPFILVGEIDSR